MMKLHTPTVIAGIFVAMVLILISRFLQSRESALSVLNGWIAGSSLRLLSLIAGCFAWQLLLEKQESEAAIVSYSLAFFCGFLLDFLITYLKAKKI